jgi:hypothetical protein
MPISELPPHFVRQKNFPKCRTFLAQQGKLFKGNPAVWLSHHLNILVCTHAYASDVPVAHRLDPHTFNSDIPRSREVGSTARASVSGAVHGSRATRKENHGAETGIAESGHLGGSGFAAARSR